MLPAFGRARLPPRSRRLDRSGKPSPSIRITWNAIRTVTPVTSCGRTGSCRAGGRPGRRWPARRDRDRPWSARQATDPHGGAGDAVSAFTGRLNRNAAPHDRRVASNRNQLRRSASSIQFSIRLAVAIFIFIAERVGLAKVFGELLVVV